MKITSIRKLSLDDEIPVSREQAQMLFSNPAWAEHMRLVAQSLDRMYDKLIEPGMPEAHTNFQRGAIKALHTVLAFEEQIAETALLDSLMDAKVTDAQAKRHSAFLNGLVELLGEENV